jgi:hypothetical protein
MPVHSCKVGKKSGFQWGKSGKCYTGKNAKKKAIKQGLAVAYATKTKPEL